MKRVSLALALTFAALAPVLLFYGVRVPEAAAKKTAAPAACPCDPCDCDGCNCGPSAEALRLRIRRPRRPRRPKCEDLAPLAVGAPKLGGKTAPDGTEAALDVPQELRLKNTAGNDGAGLCVWTSIRVSGEWQNESRIRGQLEGMRKKRGGGWPKRVDEELAPLQLPYLQYEGRDLKFLRMALKGGRMPSVTYNGRDPFYGSHSIAHMVNLVHLDEQWAAILDNNHPKDLVWMTPEEFADRWAGRGSGWAVVLLEKGPPPPVPCQAHAGGDREDDGTLPPSGWGFTYTWRWYPYDPRWVYLLDEQGVQVAAYHRSGRQFRFYDQHAGKWLAPSTRGPFRPDREPDEGRGEQDLGTVTDYGMPLDHFPARQVGEERCALNGKLVTAAEAWMALGRAVAQRKRPEPKPTPGPAPKRPLPDDADVLRLTVVGTDTERAAVLSDLATHPALTPFKGKVLMQDYPPGHVLLTSAGLPDKGFVLLIQAPPGTDGKGKVLSRSALYRGPEALAQALQLASGAQAKREPNPNYDPRKDVDLTAPQPVPGPNPDPGIGEPLPMSQIYLGIAGLLGAVLTYVLARRGGTPAPAPQPAPLPPIIPLPGPVSPPPPLLPVDPKPLLRVLFAGHPVAERAAEIVIDLIRAEADKRMQAAAGDVAGTILGLAQKKAA